MIFTTRCADPAQDPGKLAFAFLRRLAVMGDQLLIAACKFPFLHAPHLRFACAGSGFLPIRRFGSRKGLRFSAQSLFLWDGVNGLQTRKSNATVGLSTLTGSILPQVALRF